MKKFLWVFLGIILVRYCFAQNYTYRPFVEEGKIWQMSYHNEEVPEYNDYDYSYYIQGDTVIGGIECKKLYAYNERNTHETTYIMALFETDMKVYFIPSNIDHYFVLYDFGILCGGISSVTSPIHTDWEIYLENIEERYINIKGVVRRCIRVKKTESVSFEEADDPSGWWIEGVGSELGPLNTWLFGAMGNNNYFKKCTIKGKEIFSTEEFKGLITSVHTQNLKGKNCFTDDISISGINTTHNTIIHIRNEKKYITKKTGN